MNDSYSVFNLIKCSIPQRFLLGPILFSIFLYGAFQIVKNIDIASYAADSTSNCNGDNPYAEKIT